MTTVLFERISWIFNALTDTISKLKISGILQHIYDDYRQILLDGRGLFQRNKIHILSEDCLVEIFKKLDHKDLVNCSMVCGQWQSIIECHHELWYEVKFAVKDNVSKVPILSPANYPLRYQTAIQQKQNRLIAKFLTNNQIPLRRLDIDFSDLDECGFNIIAFVISFGCCRKLKRASLKWYENWSYGDSPEFCRSHTYYLALLALLHEFAGSSLLTLSTYFNWTADSIRSVTQFKHLQYLELHSVPRVHCIQKWHIDKILEQLVNLKTLKIVVTCIPKLVQQYSFCSTSLETLDISNCVNFFIGEADLPNLKNFLAEDLQCHRMGIYMHRFCLYDVLESGCPKLQNINRQPLQRNGDTWVLNKKQDKICFCSKHIKN